MASTEQLERLQSAQCGNQALVRGSCKSSCRAMCSFLPNIRQGRHKRCGTARPLPGFAMTVNTFCRFLPLRQHSPKRPFQGRALLGSVFRVPLRRTQIFTGVDRIWPGHFAPVLIRDPERGKRMVVPMRYRCRLPGWTEAHEIEKPGTYNARRDKLSTVWRKVFGHNHGIMVVDRFYESVYLHDLQRRPLVPGEREQNVEIMFTPSTGEELLVACLWTYVEAAGENPGFYTFAAITDDPPLEVVEAGHDRCPVPIQEDDIDAWLNPDPNDGPSMYAILDRRVRPFYAHQLVRKTT